MGDAQSAQREDKKDAASEEEGGKVEDVQTEQTVDKPPKTNGQISEQISELNGKADSSIAALNGHSEDGIPAVVVISPDKDASEPLKEEETPTKNNEVDQKEVPDEAHANEVPAEITEMEAKENDINEGFKKFFSNIGLKLTVKRGSTDKGEIRRRVSGEEPNESAERVRDTTNEVSIENTESNTHLSTAQDSDSPTYQTLMDITSEEFIEKEEKTTEVASDDADAGTSSPLSEDTHQGATSEEDQASPSSPDTTEIATQFKKFFTTGIFSGLRKKKKPEEEEVTEKELVDMGSRVTKDQQEDEEELSPGVERATTEGELTAESTQTMNESKSSPATELEAPSLQEKDRVQASPLKKLLSGSSLMKLPKKQKGRKSSDAKLSDSTENITDQLLSSTESAGNQKGETATQPFTDTAEEGAWASFIKLMTPQKRIKRPSVDQGEAQVPGPAEGAKPGEGEQISDHSTEEGRKRKDSSVSWEAVLCGSGRRRSRKTSDSEEDNEDNKQDSGPKEALLGTSNELHEAVASSPKQIESPPEDNEGSTWKSFKKLVTPKRKVSDDESKDIVQSDGEAAQEDSPFSIKKLLSGRKKRKSVEKPDQEYPDDADKEAASDDEDSETPAVVPLSEFDTPEATVQMQTQVDVEHYVPKQGDDELQQDVRDEMTEPVLPVGSLPAEKNEIQEDKEALDNEGPTVPATKEEEENLADLTSKYQQLSDIPEEGAITETTPASVTEVAARDDTIAEDLIEITSEAVTAPEPTDVTQADETEMVSAVSQLSESSKTSGNTTPVPAEYNIMDTEAVLQHVSETFDISPRVVPVCSEEPRTERIVSSVSHQILESSVVDQAKILELHRGSDTSLPNTGLSTEVIDAVDEFAAEAQMQSASHLKEAISTEIAAEVPDEDVDVAKAAADEVHEASVSDLQESINELQMKNESQHVEEHVSEVNEEVSTERVPEKEEELAPSNEVVTDQAEQEISKTDSQKAESVAAIAAESEEAPLKEEAQILTEKEAETIENVSEQAPASAVMDQLEPLTAASEECDVKPLEVPPSEDIPSPEMDTSEPKETAEHLTEVIDEPENKEPETCAVKIVDAKVSEALEDEQAGTLESEEGTAESLENKVSSPEDISAAEIDKNEHLTEVIDELEKKEPETVAVKIDDAEVSEALEVEQAGTLESEEDAVESIVNKEPSSDDIQPPEMDKDEFKQTAEHLTEVSDEPQTVSVKTEDAEAPEVEQAATLEPEQDAAQSLEDKVPYSEDIPTPEIDKDELKQTAEHLTEISDEPQTDAAKESEVLEVEQPTTFESGEGTIQSFEDKVPPSEDIPQPEIDTDEPKQTEQISEITQEPESKEPTTEAPTTDLSEDTEVLKEVQAATSESEESSVTPLEQVASEDTLPPTETAEQVPKDEAEPLTEADVEPEDAPETEQAQEPPAAVAATLDSEPLKEEVTEETPAEVETVPDEAKKTPEVDAEPEKLTVEPEPSPPDASDIITETETEAKTSKTPAAQVVEESTTKDLERETVLEDVPEDKPEETEKKTSEINNAGEKESIPCDAQVRHEDGIAESVEELEALTPVHVSSVSKESSSAQVLEKTVCTEETPAPCVDNAEASNEPIHEVNICGVQESVQKEKVVESPVAAVKAAASDRAVLEQAVTSNVKCVSFEKPDVLVNEPLMTRTASETELCTKVETATPLAQGDIHDISDTGRVITMMHMPTVEYEVHERVQVQLMDVDIRSAEHNVDGVIEVGVIEAKEVIDVCDETIQKVASLSAAPIVDKVVFNEGINVTVQEIIQHVQQNIAETIRESVVLNLEQVLKKPDGVTELREAEQSEATDQKVTEDSAGTAVERQDEVPAAASDKSAVPAEQEASDDHKEQSESLKSLDASIHERKEDLEETKADMNKSEVYATTDELALKKLSESTTETQRPQTSQSLIVSHSNGGLAVPQNTGVISSVGNLESPSSLSLEFKLNIHFGQTKGPAPPAERNEQADTSYAGVQVVKEEEPVQPRNVPERAESEKQPELNEVATQATEVREPAADSHSTQRAVITSQPLLHDVGIQAMEVVEPVEHIKAAERVEPTTQAAEAIRPRRKERIVLLGKPALSQTKQPFKQASEENQDQDVWLDAEEDICMQEEAQMSAREVEEPAEVQEPVEAQTEREEEKEAEPELETARDGETESKESQQETDKATTCEAESEGEDFSVALEDLETSVAAVKWD